MKKFFKALLCLTLVFTFVFASCAPAMAASSTYILRINANGVRLHYSTEGGGEASMILSLKKGTKLLYVGKANKSWIKVRTEAGLVGYVFRDYLDTIETVDKAAVCAINTTKLQTYNMQGKKTKVKLTGAQMVLRLGDDKTGRDGATYTKVQTMSGKVYYVKLSKLKKLF